MENKKDLQNRIIIFLLVVIVVLLISRGGEGRYAFAALDPSAVFVLDTKTSRLWAHTMTGNVLDLGTNKNPKNPKGQIKTEK